MTDEIIYEAEKQLPDPETSVLDEISVSYGGYVLWYIIQERDGKRTWEFWSAF